MGRRRGGEEGAEEEGEEERRGEARERKIGEDEWDVKKGKGERGSG